MPNSNFLNDKQRFFTNANTKTTDSATKEAAAQDYAFLARNRSLIEQEFNDMFTSLKKNGQNSEQFWCYCGYLSLMLESYYRAYGKFAEAEKYRQYSEDIVNGKNQRAAAAQDDFLPRLQKKLAADLSKLASTPLHTSTIREWVSFINITRLQIVFCRLTVRESLLVAHQMHWLDRIGNAFGWPVDMDGIVSTLNTPTAMLNMLSVGVFAARFMINFGMLLKHTVVPSND